MNRNHFIVRFSWLIVVAVGLSLSLAQFYHLQQMDQQMLNREIAQRSMVKLDSIHAILQQHLDATQSYMSFVLGELQTGGSIEDDEASAFTRGILSVHPDELQAVTLMPPPEMGAAIMMQQDGSISRKPPIGMPKTGSGSEPQLHLLRNHTLRIIISATIGDSTAYVACDWNLNALIQHAIDATPKAGLNVRLDMQAGSPATPTTVFDHRSRASDGTEAADKHVWQGAFDIEQVRFIVHTQAVPKLIRQFSGYYAWWVLLAGFIITALLAIFILNRIRANAILRDQVKERTQALSGERAKLAAVIDHAHDGILVMDEKGNILRSNPAADSMFGYSGQEWDSLTVHMLMPAEAERDQQWFAEEVAGQECNIIGQVRELCGQCKDGSLFPCETTVHSFTAGDERQFSVVLRDLSEFKQQQWVQQTLLQLRAISQSHSPLHRRLKEMLSALLSSPWPIEAAAIYGVQSEQLWLTASQGWQADEKKRYLMIPIGCCLCGETINDRHMPCASSVAGSQSGRHAACLPIMHEGRQLGLLHLQLAEDNDFPEIFSAFSQQAHEIVAVTLVREHIRQSLEDSESKHRQLVDATPVGIIMGTAGIVRYANPAAASMLGADSPESLLDIDILPVVDADDQGRFEQMIQTLQQGGNVEPTELRLQRMDHSVFWAEVRGVPVVYESKPSVQLLIQDISDRKQTEDQLTRLSYTDELTKLPNRRLYIDRLEQACSLAARSNRQLCLLFIDLDRFKIINDTQGHACGDLVLKTVATRIQETLRVSDTAARMGGDEFAVLLPEADPASALKVANKLTAALQRPMMLANQAFTIGASIGLAAYPDDGRESDTLLNHADSAMYYAKQNQLDIHCFSSDMEQSARRRMMLEQEMMKAVEHDQFELYYQPQHGLDPDTGTVRVIGVESLLRWQHPELGRVSPAEFIPVAEESGIIRPVTAWVIKAASQQALIWQQQGFRPEKIGINVSAVELMQVGLAEDILNQISRAGAQPEWFEIEVTETAAMSQPDTAILIMQQLVDGGISVAIDDFGTGYSSLAYLKRLPARHLKIDIAFIRHLPDDAEDAVIVSTIIAMAHSLGMKVIAEGVETREQLEFLRREGCDVIQGYLLGKPMTADEATAMLTHQSVA